MKSFCCAFLFALTLSGMPALLRAQQAVADELAFARYLAETGQQAKQAFVLRALLTASLTPAQADTVHWLLADLFYATQQADSARYHFGQVGNYRATEAAFFSAFLADYQANYEAASQIREGLQPTDPVQAGLLNLHRAGHALLLRKPDEGLQWLGQVPGQSYLFQEHAETMLTVAQDLKKFRRKSGLLAGVLSGILPGSGKIYAGNTGQGVAALLQCTALGLQAWEAWRLNPQLRNNPRLWIYGGLFSVFYVGNIWGSTLQVGIRRMEFYQVKDEQILVAMHIPLRSVFR